MYRLLQANLLRLVALLGLLAPCLIGSVVQANDDELPGFTVVQKIIDEHFAAERDFQRGDLISKRDLIPIFNALASQGWKVADREEILALALDDGSAVVQTLRTRDGSKFMRKVSGYKLIYDRLDRISREAGGRRLLADLVKLPDAQRYARFNTPRGVPSMLDFLPKIGSGKRRKIKDYDKPTGRIYTVEAYIKRLQESYAEALRKA